MIVDAVPGAGVGNPVVLKVDGTALSLDGVVARNDENGTLVKFKLTEAAGKLVKDVMAGRGVAA